MLYAALVVSYLEVALVCVSYITGFLLILPRTPRHFWIHRTSWPWPCGFFHYASLRYIYEEPIAGYSTKHEGRSSATIPEDLIQPRLTRKPGVREVEVAEYDKKYHLRSRFNSATSGKGYQKPVDLGPETPEVSEAETPIHDVPAAEQMRESAARSTRVTRQSTRNQELDIQTSTSPPAAVASAPEYVMESIVELGYAEDGELLYRIRWYPLPPHIDEAMVG